MNSTNAGIKVLRALAKHAEIITLAYESGNNQIPERMDTTKAIEELIRLRLAIRDESHGGVVRLNSTVKNLMDYSLKTIRLKMVNVDIGEAVDGILFLAEAYNKAKNAGANADSAKYLNDLDSNVVELCDSLTDQARDIWRQIDSDFGSVSLLSGKIALNKNALNKVQRILKSLELIDLETMHKLSSRDSEMRKLLHVRLPDAIDSCRRDLSDAIHRLNRMMFKLNQLAARARMVSQMVDHYALNPSFEPEDYTQRLDIPGICHVAYPIPVMGMVDISNQNMEIEFSDIIGGLRNEPPPDERQEFTRITTSLDEQVTEQLQWGEIQEAIREVFLACLSDGRTISGIDSFLLAPKDTDLMLWLYALITTFNAMSEAEQALFTLDYPGEFDPVFTANYHARDVILCPA